MILSIVQYNDPRLRQKGHPVKAFDAELKTLFQDMVETMHEADGIGLAAQQIGKALQFCVVDVRHAQDTFSFELDGRSNLPAELIMPLAVANPIIRIASPETGISEEGCLSIPDIRGEVERPERIRVDFQDLEGRPHTLECDGIFARCLLHEADHLDGILFLDRMQKKDLKAVEKKLKILKRRTRDALNTARTR
jgi:peptide deformylase